jgi:hypothetical protein
MATRMAAALRALWEGEITFQRFERETRRDWDKLAGKMWGRWQLPAGVSEDDVRQEMLLGAWKAVAKYDPARGVGLANYVVWEACNRAAKWLHGQRKAKRRDGKSPSRHALTMGALRVDVDGELGASEAFDLFQHTDPDQEQRTDHALVMSQVEGMAATPLDLDAVRSWVRAGGDVVEAGVELWLDAVARADHGLRSPRQAVRAVERAVDGVRRGMKVDREEASP